MSDPKVITVYRDGSVGLFRVEQWLTPNASFILGAELAVSYVTYDHTNSMLLGVDKWALDAVQKYLEDFNPFTNDEANAA